jgi:hypothetical protein
MGVADVAPNVVYQVKFAIVAEFAVDQKDPVNVAKLAVYLEEFVVVALLVMQKVVAANVVQHVVK